MTHVVDAEGYMTEMQYNATGEVVKTIEYARAVADAQCAVACSYGS